MQRASLKANALLNIVRRGSAILFPTITFSYVSHKLGAERMGAFSFSESVISYFLLFAALGISTYAVREGQVYKENKNKLEEFISEVYTINVIMTFFSYVALGILLLAWRKLAEYGLIVLILSISIVLTTIGADWINTLFEDFLFITVRQIAIQMLSLILLIILVKGPNDIYKYAMVVMISSIGVNLLNIIYIRRKISFHITSKPNFRRHIIPMITMFSNSLAIKIYLLADVTILGVLMADHYVGYYTAASKVYTAVKEMVNAMIIVTLPRFSYYLSHNDCEKYEASYGKVYDGVVTLIFPSVIGLFFQAENVLYVLGGAEYIPGADALRILAIAMIFAVMACLFSQAILIPNKQEIFFLRATVVAAVGNIVLNFVLIPLLGIEAAAFTTLLSEGIVCSMALFKGRQFISKIYQFDADAKSALVGSIGVICVCFLTKLLIINRFWNLVVSVIGSSILYFTTVYFMKNQTVCAAISNIKNHILK